MQWAYNSIFYWPFCYAVQCLAFVFFSSSQSVPRLAVTPAATGWGRMGPATSSRWYTTASSTGTCSSSVRPTTWWRTLWGWPMERWVTSSRSGTGESSTRSSSRYQQTYLRTRWRWILYVIKCTCGPLHVIKWTCGPLQYVIKWTCGSVLVGAAT